MRAVQVLAVAERVVAELQPWSRMGSTPQGRTAKDGPDMPPHFFFDPLSAAGLVLRSSTARPKFVRGSFDGCDGPWQRRDDEVDKSREGIAEACAFPPSGVCRAFKRPEVDGCPAKASVGEGVGLVARLERQEVGATANA